MAVEGESITANAPVFRQACGPCALRGWCWSPQLDECDISRVHAIVRRSGSLPAGNHLFRTNDPFTAIHAVRSGCIKTYSSDQCGHEYVHGFHLVGELLGFDAVYPETHQFNAQLLEDTLVCTIPYRDIADLGRQLPGLESHLLTLVSREFSHHLMLARGCGATERVTVFLCDIERRLRRTQLSNFEFDLPMSREDIASYSRCSPETLSRILSKLQHSRIIAVDRRHFRFLDVSRLNRIAQGEKPPMYGRPD